MSIEQADNFFDKEDYTNALKIYQLLTSDPDKEIRLNAYIGTGQSLFSLERDIEAKKAFDVAFQLSTTLKDNKSQALIKKFLGLISMNEKRFYESIDYLTESISFYEKENEKFMLKSLYKYLGRNFRIIGDIDSSLENYKKVLNLLEDDDDLYERLDLLTSIAGIYSEIDKEDKAIQTYNEALKISRQTGDKKETGETLRDMGFVYYNRGQIKEALKMYNDSLSIFREMKDKDNEIKSLGSIALIYTDKKKYNKALAIFNQCKSFFKETEDEDAYAINLTHIAYLYYKKGDKNAAIEHFKKSVEIYQTDVDPNAINLSLDDIEEINPLDAYALAKNSPYGRNWLLTNIKDSMQNNIPVNGSLWKYGGISARMWWNAYNTANKDNNQWITDQYSSNWLLNQRIDNTQEEITNEVHLNFIIGSNDIGRMNQKDMKKLRQEERNILPMWFIELPLFLEHDSQYLKIRLNNLIRWEKKFVGYPKKNVEKVHFERVQRIKIQLETQWLKRFVRDHVFYPNTEEEYQEIKKRSESAWLSDVFLWDIGDKIREEEFVEINLSCQLYFDKNSIQPDVQTTTTKFIIPIIRKNIFQKIEKIRLRRTNLLTLIIAISSLLASFISTVYPFFENYLRLLSPSDLIPFGILTVLLICFFLLISYIALKKPINKDKLDDKVEF